MNGDARGLSDSGIRVLLITGSTRRGSTNAAALATLAHVRPPGVRAQLYDGLAKLPAFNPDDDQPPYPAEVAHLRNEIAAADALIFCTPEYAGTLPGSFKNLLDWTVGGTEISAKPVCWINVGAAGRGRGAIATLEVVLGYLGVEVLDAACRQVPVGREDAGADGLISDPAVTAELRGIWSTLLNRLAPSHD
ncbi:NAD(P)H-dependent oxidoreductase [Jatrophihabitans telluris]|uniref:NAD(P)H-dependent oxidoreductase n=1 Tax=Jatrophihabitans telluris TaxID=2038343 RepID=A0ABY4R1S6_9ACTN|nr:NADPH-dependent FMN reductase [Jatrophihabitans telluris]UQX89462.1 NAD(P)H-dependent oxidoreductase [Jatrophihabitans telluris]